MLRHGVLPRLLLAAAAAPLVCALDPNLLISQYHKRQWQVEDGLPHNYVMAVLPAPDGYLLVASDEGLARFDGVRFIPADLEPSLRLSKRWILTLMNGRDGSLWAGAVDGGIYRFRGGRLAQRFETGASVFALLEDRSGRVWASTRNGVLLLGPKRPAFAAVPELPRPPDTGWNVLAEDASGAVWIVTVSGLHRAQGDAIARVAGAEAGEILAVYAGSGGVLWAGTSRGLYRIEWNGNRARLARQAGIPGPVVAVRSDRDGVVWAGTWGHGLYRLAGSRTDSWSARDGLPDDFIRTLYEDAEGNLWVGTRGGLSRWKNPRLIPFGTAEGLSGNFATTVVDDGAGGMLLGTWRGGLYRFRNGALVRLPTPVPTLFYAVRALAAGRRGDIWTGNWEGVFRLRGGGYRHYGEPGSPYRHVAALLFDRVGRLWVGTSDNGIFLFSDGKPAEPAPPPLLPQTEITCLHEDTEGRVWAGTPNGAGWFDAGTPPRFATVAGLPAGTIASISGDRSGRTWAATLGGALCAVTPAGAAVLDTRHGLPEHPLYKLVEDRAGWFWISSPKGIVRLAVAQVNEALAGRRRRLDVSVFDQDDGMRTIECHRLSQPAGGSDAQGNLWFPTTKGFVLIRPEGPRPSKPPPVFIEEAASDGSPMAPGPELRLRPGAHNLEVRFTALRFASPEKIQFRYRMLGFDPDWLYDNGTRTARYSGLPPGSYRFVVTASEPGGPWSDPAATVEVTQMPRFHQTGWFLLLAVLAAGAAAAALVRWRVHIIKGRYAAVLGERNRISREWHDSLVAGFSAISLQIEASLARLREDPSRAAEILEVARKMVHHYRAEARRVIWDLRDTRPVSEDLTDAIGSALRQATSGTGIAAAVQVTGEREKLPEDLEHNMLRICQEAFANAVRHGKPTRLDVRVEYAPGVVRLRVHDDGTGFRPSEHSDLNPGHFGLTVMQERARRFGGDLRIESSPGEGTTVQASIPVKAVRKP